MTLVKIEGYWINTDNVCFVEEEIDENRGTNTAVECMGTSRYFCLKRDEVAKLLLESMKP